MGVMLFTSEGCNVHLHSVYRGKNGYEEHRKLPYTGVDHSSALTTPTGSQLPDGSLPRTVSGAKVLCPTTELWSLP